MLGPAPPARALTGSLNEASSRPPVTAAVSSVQRGCSDTRVGSTSVAIAAIRHASIEHRSRATRPAPTADAAAMFRALADPARLRLLVRLAGDEANVSQLAGDQKLTTVSARLQFLLAARLVRRRREARQMFYAFADEHTIDRVANAMDHAGERYENAPRTAPSPEDRNDGVHPSAPRTPRPRARPRLRPCRPLRRPWCPRGRVLNAGGGSPERHVDLPRVLSAARHTRRAGLGAPCNLRPAASGRRVCGYQ
jgi:ArsR family transcriptional regulator